MRNKTAVGAGVRSAATDTKTAPSARAETERRRPPGSSSGQERVSEQENARIVDTEEVGTIAEDRPPPNNIPKERGYTKDSVMQDKSVECGTGDARDATSHVLTIKGGFPLGARPTKRARLKRKKDSEEGGNEEVPQKDQMGEEPDAVED